MSTTDFATDLNGYDRSIPLLLDTRGRNQKYAEFKLKHGSLLTTFLIGYCIEMTAMFATSSTFCSVFLVASGVTTMLLQCWINSIQFSWTTNSFFVQFSVCLVLILSFHSGYFFAWTIAYFLLGGKIVPQTLLGVLFFGLCVAYSWRVNTYWQEHVTYPLTAASVKYEAPPATAKMGLTSPEVKLKLGSMILGCAFGYGTQMTVTLVVLTHTSSWPSSIPYCMLLVAIGFTMTILQSWITSLRLRWESSSLLNAEFILWLAASALCFLSGFFFSWVINDYCTGHHRRFIYHFWLEMMCLANFLLLIWVVIFEKSSKSPPSQCDGPDANEMSFEI